LKNFKKNNQRKKTMINIETEDETLKFFQKMNDENWVSDTELFEKGYELNKNKENCEKMTKVRANRKNSISGMKKPKGIEEWCD
jgi:ribosomal protein S8